MEAALKSVEDKLDIVRELTRGVMASQLSCAVVRGEPGVGKSHTVMEVVNSVRRENQTVVRVTGHITPLKAFYALGDAQGRGSVTIFDDCDDIFTELASLNLLKAAVDTKANRVVTWGSSMKGMPYTDFEFHGGVIVLTNADFRGPHYRAFMDRVHFFDLKISKEEKVAKIFDVARKLEGVDEQTGLGIVTWLLENQALIDERLSLRTFVKVAELAKFTQNWKTLAKATLFNQAA
jgi:hypothetical protein